MGKHYEHIQALADSAQEELFGYLSIPTISAQRKGISETVEYVKEMLLKRGAEVKVLDDLGGNPVIYAHLQSKRANSPTLLFYNHYDVQPPEPFDEWLSEPFTPEIRDGILYCRGVADNKGNLVARLFAIDYLLASTGDIPCNIKFLIEGEEEIGSPHLEPYLKKYASLWKADGCIWEFGGKQEDESFVIDCGLKGLIYMELNVRDASIDAHSSLAAVLDNSAWRLTQALASMKSVDNHILVKGFYDDVVAPTAYELERALEVEVNYEDYQKNFGLKRPFIQDGINDDPRFALTFSPTLTINGLLSGYINQGSKTVLPKQAMGKIECRLVLGQTPGQIEKCFRAHLTDHGFDDIDLTVLAAQAPYRSSMDAPFIKLVESSARTIYDPESKVLIRPTNAGTGPMDLFGEYLNLPIATSGAGWAKSQAHAPNESVRMHDYIQSIEHMVELMQHMRELEG